MLGGDHVDTTDAVQTAVSIRSSSRVVSFTVTTFMYSIDVPCVVFR